MASWSLKTIKKYFLKLFKAIKTMYKPPKGTDIQNDRKFREHLRSCSPAYAVSLAQINSYLKNTTTNQVNKKIEIFT